MPLMRERNRKDGLGHEGAGAPAMVMSVPAKLV
jgi:hypothetical protein